MRSVSTEPATLRCDMLYQFRKLFSSPPFLNLDNGIIKLILCLSLLEVLTLPASLQLLQLVSPSEVVCILIASSSESTQSTVFFSTIFTSLCPFLIVF